MAKDIQLGKKKRELYCKVTEQTYLLLTASIEFESAIRDWTDLASLDTLGSDDWSLYIDPFHTSQILGDLLDSWDQCFEYFKDKTIVGAFQLATECAAEIRGFWAASYFEATLSYAGSFQIALAEYEQICSESESSWKTLSSLRNDGDRPGSYHPEDYLHLYELVVSKYLPSERWAGWQRESSRNRVSVAKELQRVTKNSQPWSDELDPGVPHMERLSDYEKSVVKFTKEGLTNESIGERLGTSKGAIATCKSRLGARGHIQAVVEEFPGESSSIDHPLGASDHSVQIVEKDHLKCPNCGEERPVLTREQLNEYLSAICINWGKMPSHR